MLSGICLGGFKNTISFPNLLLMEDSLLKLNILPSVDSTNNYAMGQAGQGLAEHGEGWLALEQTHGKGRRGKGWKTEPGSNIMMSIAIIPRIPLQDQFRLSASVALAVQKQLTKYIEDLKIKWPNDIYWQDRKAGGILIENIIKGNQWAWTIIGLGINVNQVSFDPGLPNPVSLKQISSLNYDIGKLAGELQAAIIQMHKKLCSGEFDEIYEEYNANLYKRGEKIWLKKGNARFLTTIKSVDRNGNLLVSDTMERSFGFDEISWEIPEK